jgi:hypothetical protein
MGEDSERELASSGDEEPAPAGRAAPPLSASSFSSEANGDSDVDSPVPDAAEPYAPAPPKEPTRRKRQSGADPDAPPTELEVIMKTFAPGSSRLYVPEPEIAWDERAKAVLNRMQAAVEADHRSFAAGKPPFARLNFMKELYAAIANRHLLR